MTLQLRLRNMARSIFILQAFVGIVLLHLADSCNAAPVDDRIKVEAVDWPWWRGPQRNGIANPDQNPPTSWSNSDNVVWKAKVPGRGHGSPTVVGNRVLLATSDKNSGSQSVLCFDRTTGKLDWQTEVHSSGGMRKNEKSTAASSTIACDGEQAYITFANSGAVYATALDLNGKRVWQTKVCDYHVHQGYASSPAVYQSLVIVSADTHSAGAVAALDRKNGNIVWKHDRPKLPNYTSPIILNVAGRDQLLMSGCNLFTSFAPLSGEKLWEVEGATTEECVTSIVTDGDRLFCSGGYPRFHVSAVRTDGSHEVSWEIKDRVYVPSMLVRDGYLFGVLDAGVAACWNSETGETEWKHRLGGDFSASPVMVGDLIYATNELGQTFVYKADPKKYVEIAMNQLGDQQFATPTICGSQIFMRVVEQIESKPVEALYCIGKGKNSR